MYGRIDIGNYPAPVPIYAEPIIFRRVPSSVQLQPIYLYVPPGHQKNWGKHCGRYNACGQPVYFVPENWVRERYDDDRREHGDRGQDNKRDKQDKQDKHERKHGKD